MKGKKVIQNFLRSNFVTDQVFWNNEVQANRLVGFTMLMSSILLIATWVLNYVGVFQTGTKIMNSLMLQGVPELLIPAALCYFFKGEKRWLKYLMMVAFTIVLARIDSIMGYNATLIMIVPVVLSCRYFSERFTAQVALATTILFAVSAFTGVFFDLGVFDLNFYEIPSGIDLHILTTLKQAVRDLGIDAAARTQRYMLLAFLPKYLIFVVIAITCARISRKGRGMVLEHASAVNETARIESELNLATDIQANMLPRIFPAFPNHDEFDIFATMSPAKEVGGDFYDYFMLDDRRLAVVIADVSGKGVPAAFFMVIAKTLIKNYAQTGLTPEEVFTRVNQILCESNDAGLFVTAWMGVIDLETGLLTYVNAGHNPPMIRCGNGRYERLVAKPGFVLAGMEGMRYHQFEKQLHEGDKLFLYTDGVTEATNTALDQYGEQRMVDYLNAHAQDSVSEVLYGLRRDLNAFVGDAEQFDDITMLIMYYKKAADDGMMEKEFAAKTECLQEVIAFVETQLEQMECPMKVSMQIAVAVEEIFVNIASYAYTDGIGKMKLAIGKTDDGVIIRFSDHGMPFDPLAKEDPDVKLSAQERSIGGLGIFMVKKTMDDVQYRFENGQNILTITKKY